MQPINKHLIYFSAAGTTKKIAQSIFEGIGIAASAEYSILQGQSEEVGFSENDLVVFALPVYSGRIPSISIEALNKFKGNTTPAIIVVVYGNREYDDALLELKNTVEVNGFKVISAGAFVAEHSIFPAVAAGRPDDKDKAAAQAFGRASWKMCQEIADVRALPEIVVKGNFPYRDTKPIPLKPTGNRHCNNCGACAKGCPTKAIEAANPRKTDKSRCISCAHCIVICPQKARRFGGFIYKIAGRKFTKAFGGARKEPELFFLQNEIKIQVRKP